MEEISEIKSIAGDEERLQDEEKSKEEDKARSEEEVEMNMFSRKRERANTAPKGGKSKRNKKTPKDQVSKEETGDVKRETNESPY